MSSLPYGEHPSRGGPVRSIGAVDTVVAPAFFLASRKRDGYPGFGVSRPGPDTGPVALAEALETASRVPVAVVTVAGADARAAIWRRSPGWAEAGAGAPSRGRG